MHEIDTARLWMRPYERTDIDALAPFYADPEVTAFTKLGRQTRQQSEAILNDYIRTWRVRGFGMRALFLKPSADYVGECGLFWHKTFEAPSMRYALVRDVRGRGLAKEAIEHTLADAFEVLGLAKIYSVVQAQNHVSMHIMEALGFARERRSQHQDVELVIYSSTRAHSSLSAHR